MILVIQEGVYRHAIIGIYQDRNEAINAAKLAAELDRDNWHSYNGYAITNFEGTVRDSGPMDFLVEGDFAKEEKLFSYAKEFPISIDRSIKTTKN